MEGSTNLPTVSTGRKLYLSWSHYLLLMCIGDVDERHFYEIESAVEGWSLKELKRQFNSALYERLALSLQPRDLVAQLLCRLSLGMESSSLHKLFLSL